MPTLCKQYDGIPCDAAHPSADVINIELSFKLEIFEST